MIRLLVALLVLVCFSDAAGARGPVRNWIASHRPGIVFPKHSAHAVPQGCAGAVTVGGCASGQCANGACTIAETGPATLGTKPLTLPLKIVPLKK